MTYDAILLTSFGGPEGPEDVMPYLERVTAGRGVPRERLEEVSHHYLALGGVSPINEQNRQLLAALRARFPERGIDLPVYWGNRNSEPFLGDVVREMAEHGHRRILAWVTSAYSSYSGCRQYREDLYRALAGSGLVGTLMIDKVRPYFDHPGFLAPVAARLRSALGALEADGHVPGGIEVLFVTHSIPLSMAETSGPPATRAALADRGGAYVAQHLVAADLVMSDLETDGRGCQTRWQLVYQSRSGAPTDPWLEPDISEAIGAAADRGTTAVVVVPIGFVSDHVEVVWDLDHEARESAQHRGLAFIRVETPGTDALFVDGIADLVLERLDGGPRKAGSPLGPWPDACAVGCCPNPRRELPTVADDSGP